MMFVFVEILAGYVLIGLYAYSSAYNVVVVFHKYPDSIKRVYSAKCFVAVLRNIKHSVAPRYLVSNSLKQTV